MHQKFAQDALDYDSKSNVNAGLIMHEPKNLTDTSYAINDSTVNGEQSFSHHQSTGNLGKGRLDQV